MSLSGGLRMSVEASSYPVIGSTARDLRSAMMALGPVRGGKPFGAFTDWRVEWHYATKPWADGFRIADVRVDVRAVVITPRWRAPRSASAPLKARWGEFLHAVEVHERGHLNYAREAGRTVFEQLERLPSFSTLAELRQAALEVAHAAVERVRIAEHHYDTWSGHGSAHGVRLDDTNPIAGNGTSTPAFEPFLVSQANREQG